MLQNDEEFTRKIIGCMQQATPQLLRVQVTGNMVLVTATNGRRAEIPGATFYRLSVKEILELVGVKANDKAYRI